ncbi:TetR family transcriptional regulator C-terminal domain-containing protein [Stappia indica]|uniref:TetR family transcriptional regulator C-terminal domain-containing protein n=1 Tax=Stappia indica TaxID=538381 RepID=UPI001CD6404B|nr:TetR family transcriptional regulator C-terminal domain-containing protein [Stappia indica]MCA1299622.1 TetR family transcriptional regulator C-terminal domain-containing protein [Stappia indica]
MMMDGSATAPGGTRTRIQERNRARILDAALVAFARFGYRGARVEQIAEAAGMSKSNLLYYFRSKTEMYKAVLAALLERWLAPLRTLDPEGDPRAELTAYIEQKLRFSAEEPEASRLFANEVMQGAPMIRDVLEGPLKELVDEKTGVLRRWAAEGRIRDVDPHQLIFLIWATTQHYADFAPQIAALTGREVADPAYRAEVLKTLTALIFDGLLPPA